MKLPFNDVTCPTNPILTFYTYGNMYLIHLFSIKLKKHLVSTQMTLGTAVPKFTAMMPLVCVRWFTLVTKLSSMVVMGSSTSSHIRGVLESVLSIRISW